MIGIEDAKPNPFVAEQSAKICVNLWLKIFVPLSLGGKKFPQVVNLI
jgi:hypothetical protein